MNNLITTSSQFKAIWQMSWPMLIIVTLLFWVGIVDVYVAGLISAETQAAIGFSVQVYFISSILANAIGIGTVALVSRLIGASQRKKAIETARQSVTIGLGIALLISSFVYLFSNDLTQIIGVPEELKNISTSLLQIYAIGILANYVMIVANSVFRASGEVLKQLFCMSVVGILNMCLILPFTFGFMDFRGLGAIGIASAMALAHVVGAFIALSFFNTDKWKGFYTFKWHFDKDSCFKLLSIGWPSALLQFAWHGGSLVIYNILGRLPTDNIVAIASLTNGMRIEAVIFLPAFALNMAASTLIGQNLGAGNPQRATKIGYKIAGLSALIVSLMSLIIFIFAHDIASLLSSDKSVINETVRYLYYNLTVEPFMAVGVVLAGAMQGAGDTKGVMKLIITSMWFIRLPLAWILALYFRLGAQGVWIAMITSMAIQCCLLAYRFHQGKWQKNEIIS